MSAVHSTAAAMVRSAHSSMPTSFNNDGQLFGFNLFLMTAFMCLGLLMAARLFRALWRDRLVDGSRDPVTIWRMAWCCAAMAAFLRCGIEAMNLWAWNPADPVTTARVIMAKRWVDPVALIFAAGWMVLVMLSSTSMEQQLRKRPFPVEMWARLPELRRPAAIVVLSFVAAVGVAITR